MFGCWLRCAAGTRTMAAYVGLCHGAAGHGGLPGLMCRQRQAGRPRSLPVSSAWRMTGDLCTLGRMKALVHLELPKRACLKSLESNSSGSWHRSWDSSCCCWSCSHGPVCHPCADWDSQRACTRPTFRSSTHRCAHSAASSGTACWKARYCCSTRSMARNASTTAKLRPPTSSLS